MNERIRELRREAEKWVADNFSTDELDPYEWWEKEEQKFAELIVEECIICAEREWIRHGSNSVHNKAIHKVIESIKKHFGVEE